MSSKEASESSAPQKRNVFILGHDKHHQQDVTQIVGLEHINVHSLLDSSEIVHQTQYDVEKSLEKARLILNSFDRVDGIVCHWDFPVTFIHSILCEEYNVPGPPLFSLFKCSHKYWSRLEQRRIVPDNTPEFCSVNPFDENALEKVTLDYPFWVKPVASFSSVLGFKIENESDFKHAMGEARKNIKKIGVPFTDLLSRVGRPDEIKKVDGNWMIAEQYISGIEFAPEGYVQGGECHIHGVIDMVIGPNGKSFERYEYPSTAPQAVQRRAIAVSKKLMEEIGLDNGCFNIEYFWNATTDDLWIVEINPRISQSHSYLFEMVKGLSNHEVAIKVAFGKKPHFDEASGPYQRAAKFLHRRYEKQNMRATRVPDEKEIVNFQSQCQPDTLVYPRLQEGMQLDDMREQDSYSYVIADLLIAGQSREELEQKYREAITLLPFEFEPVDQAVVPPPQKNQARLEGRP